MEEKMERKMSFSIGFTATQLSALESLQGSISSHVRKAVNEYLIKLGVIKNS